jgi:hypothetical protein
MMQINSLQLLHYTFKSSSTQCLFSYEDIEYMSQVPYSSAPSSLMHPMVCNHAHLSYVMSCVSRYMANPGGEHWKVV